MHQATWIRTGRAMRMTRIVGAACALLLALRAVSHAHAAAAADPSPPPFPSIPSAYSATVVLTLSHINTTSSFEEIYDGTLSGGQGVLRTNGRFADADLAEIFDLGLNTSVSFSNTPSSSSSQAACTRTNILDRSSTASSMLHPTRDIVLSYASEVPVEYQGRSRSAATRFIECESWGYSRTIPLPSGPDDTEGGGGGGVALRESLTFYAALSSLPGIEYAPVRLEVSVSQVNLASGAVLASLFDIKIDWADFQFQKPNAAMHFTAPPASDVCPPPASDAAQLPPHRFDESFFNEAPLPPAPVPTAFPARLPSNFRMVLEEKLNVRLDGSDATKGSDPLSPPPSVRTYQWAVSPSVPANRIDFDVMTASAANNPDSGDDILVGDGEATRIARLSESALGGATVFEFRSWGGGADGKAATCTTSARTPSTRSPLDSRRAGSIPALFSGGLAAAERDTGVDGGADWTYQGRSTLRGIEVEQWRSSRIRFNGDALFSWTMDLFVVVDGWHFPGRAPLPEGMALPMRVIESGTWLNNSVTAPVPYTDVYDFIRVLPDAAVDALFDPAVAFAGTGVTCPATAPTRPADAEFPHLDLNTAYHTKLSAAMLNRGYTLTYDEWYDPVSRRLRTDGRLTGAHSVEVADLAAGTSTVWSTAGDDLNCYVVPTRPGASSAPVAQFFVDYASLLTPSNYIGRQADADSRYVLTDRWQATTGLAIPSARGGPDTWSNFTATFYSSVAAPGIGGAEPIRIKLAGASYQKDPLTGGAVQSTARVFFHQYEFLDFAFGAHQPGTFDVPPHIQQPCLQRNALPSHFSTGPLPRTPALVLPAADDKTGPPARPLSNSFSALLEAKVWPSSTGSDAREAPTLYSIEWGLERGRGGGRQQRERISLLQADGTFLHQLVLYDAYPHAGTSYTQNKDGTCAAVAFDTRTAAGAAAAARARAPLLWSHFSGALQSALIGDPEETASSGGGAVGGGSLSFVDATSFGIQSDRGVVADRFTGRRIPPAAASSAPDAHFNYTSEFFQSNAGWVYAGATQGGSRPIRVSVSGHAGAEDGVSGAPVPYHAVLDVFHYDPLVGSQADALFNLTALCGIADADAGAGGGSGGGGGSSGSATGVDSPPPFESPADTSTAAIVIMVLLLIGVVVAVSWFLYARWHNHNARQAHQRKAAVRALQDSDDVEGHAPAAHHDDVELAFDQRSSSQSRL